MQYDIVFSIGDCNNIKYYMPIIQHAKKRKITYSFDLNFGWNKWCSISFGNNLSWVKTLMKNHNIPEFSREKDVASVRICNEGRHNPENREKDTLIYSLTSLTDYTYTYFKYIDNIDFCVFPSTYFTKFFEDEKHVILGTGGEKTKDIVKKTKQSIEDNKDKNLFLGSTKYDCLETFKSKKEICEKYNLNPEFQYVLFMYPRANDLQKTQYSNTLKEYQAKDYKIISKTRRKDPFAKKEDCIDYYFYDKEFWPSTTLELIQISDKVVNTDSCTVKESVMLETEIVNINSKDYNVLEHLYEKNGKKNYLWSHNASEKLLDHITKILSGKNELTKLF